MKSILLSIALIISTFIANAQCPISANIGAVNTPSGTDLLRYTFYDLSSFGSFSDPAYRWIDYGDGSTGGDVIYSFVAPHFTHSYSAAATYTITYAITSKDSFTHAIICTDTFTTTINVGSDSCATTVTSVTNPNGSITFTATTPSGMSGMLYNWDFGDGNYGSGSPVTHTYSSQGGYTVTLQASDSLTCWSTNSSYIYIDSPNVISGFVFADSNSLSGISNPQIRVWLVTFDSLSNILTAIDSVDIYPLPNSDLTYYEFTGKPSDVYRTKAHLINGPTTGTTFVPTYHASSLYWNTATLIYHYGAASINKHIALQTGTAVSGPGFIGGDVTLGSNRGTSAGVPGLLIFLRDASGNLVTSTYTDANGLYSFSNLPVGTYSVYPENGGFATTAYTVMLSAGSATKNSINFGYDETDKTITPKNTSVTNVNTNSFAVYPNPGNGIVSVSLASNVATAEISVTDVVGKRLYSHTINNTNTARLDLSALAPGQYLITVKTAGVTTSQKLSIRY